MSIFFWCDKNSHRFYIKCQNEGKELQCNLIYTATKGPFMAYLDCRIRTRIQTLNPMATLYYAKVFTLHRVRFKSFHTAQSQIQKFPYCIESDSDSNPNCQQQESESESISESVSQQCKWAITCIVSISVTIKFHHCANGDGPFDVNVNLTPKRR